MCMYITVYTCYICIDKHNMHSYVQSIEHGSIGSSSVLNLDNFRLQATTVAIQDCLDEGCSVEASLLWLLATSPLLWRIQNQCSVKVSIYVCVPYSLSPSLPPSLSLFAVKALMELDQKLARDEAKIKETLPARLVLKTSLGH